MYQLLPNPLWPSLTGVKAGKWQKDDRDYKAGLIFNGNELPLIIDA